MNRNFIYSMTLYLVCMLLVFIYSFSIFLISNHFWPQEASGSLIIDSKNNIRGSFLLSQNLNSEKYFYSRPINSKMNCNMSLYGDIMKKSLNDEYKKLVNKSNVSMISPSSSLLDPYIMKDEALFQALEIAKVRNIDANILENIIQKRSLSSSYPFFKLEIVNTTLLNFIIDDLEKNR